MTVATHLSSRGALDCESYGHRGALEIGRPRGKSPAARALHPLLIASDIKLFRNDRDSFENVGRNDKTNGKTNDLEKSDVYQRFCDTPSKTANLSEIRPIWRDFSFRERR